MVEDKKVTEGRRVFNDPIDNTEYYIAAPTADDVRGADWQYSKTYTKSLIDGITTSAEMMDILMRRGVIGSEFERRQKELTDILATKIGELNLANDLDNKQVAALDVATAREELFNWNQRLNGPMSNTCEQIADDARLEYLTSCMVQNKEAERVWQDYEEFLTAKNQALATRARFEVMLYLQGLDSDFLEKTPEAQAIKEIEEEIQAKAEEAMAELERSREEQEKAAATKAEADKAKSETTPRKKKPGPKKGSRKKKSSE